MNNNKVKKDLLKEYISFLPKNYKIENETAKKVFAVLYFYSKMNEHQPFTIGQRTIAEDAMLSQMTVSRSMNVLIEKYKYVECKKGHLKQNSTYQILPPSIETSVIKNDMFQQDPMFQQNVSTEMIHDVSINTTDTEEVTLNQKTQMFQCDSEGKEVGQMFHKYNYNNNINTNIVEISNIDIFKNSKDKKEKVEKEMATKIEENFLKRLETMATLLERLMEKTNLPTPTFEEKKSEEVEGLKVKLSQLEEAVESQAEEITHLNERLDKAGKAFLELRNSINSTSTQVEEKKTYTTQPTYSTNVDNSYSKEKGEYVKAIKAFYDFKRESNLEECQKMVLTLQKLTQTGKLTEDQIQKIDKCEEILGEWERKDRGYRNPLKYGIDGRMTFSTYQAMFYEILRKKDLSEEDFKELTKIVKTIQFFPNLPKENFNKIIDIYSNLIAKEPERKKAYFTEYYAYRNAFRTMLVKGDDEELIYQLCQKYSEYLLTFRQLPKEILRKANMEEVLLFSKGCWSDEVIRWKWNYEKKASTSLQKEESGTTDHTEGETRSEGLKTAKNEVLTNVDTAEISETKVEVSENTKEKVKTEVVENSPVSLQSGESGTTDHTEGETRSEGLKSGKNEELTSVNSAYNPPIKIEEGKSTLFIPLNSSVSEDDLVAKMLGDK